MRWQVKCSRTKPEKRRMPGMDIVPSYPASMGVAVGSLFFPGWRWGAEDCETRWVLGWLLLMHRKGPVGFREFFVFISMRQQLSSESEWEFQLFQHRSCTHHRCNGHKNAKNLWICGCLLYMGICLAQPRVVRIITVHELLVLQPPSCFWVNRWNLK